MAHLYRHLLDILKRGQAVALAIIVERKGATPRGVGAQMIVHPLGRHMGTVGGGCGEAEVIRAGLDVIQSGQPTLVDVDLTEPISLESTAVCGGRFRVYVEPWTPSSEALALVEACLAAERERKPIVRATVIAADGEHAAAVGARAVLVDEDWVGHLPLGARAEKVRQEAQAARRAGTSRLARFAFPEGNLQVFFEVHLPPPHLIIAGAGHIGMALAELGKINGFRVTVVDDRPAFANRERFPTADEVVVAPMAQVLREMPVDENTYVVLVTRGHQLDFECLQAMIGRRVGYLGMIGSRRRVRAVFQLLAEEKGVPREHLAHVHAPIGLDIGAETPAEIATAIMAEIILVRRGGTGRPLSELTRSRTQHRATIKSSHTTS